MKPLNITNKGPSVNDDGTYHEVLAQQHERQPYNPPRVVMTQPSIQGGDITYVAETCGGLWSS